VVTPLRQANRHHLRVSRVVEEGPGVVSIEVAGHHLHELEAEAGHFFRWRFLTPENWLTPHPFSLSASPTADRLRLTVKSLGAGSASLQSVQVGTRVLAEGPYATICYLVGRDPDCFSAERLARLVPGLAEHDVYLCGPLRMAQAARHGLRAAGLPARRLHEERFAF
jgi:ferredoxin-NADP reductase